MTQMTQINTDLICENLVSSVGLLPAAISTGMGSEIQKPLAIMVVDGILICMVLSFTVLPQVFFYVYRGKYTARKS